MPAEEYTWERYYEDVFRRQKKYNNNLAVRIGELDSRTAELQAQLDRITNSSYWKLLAPARKLYGRLRGIPGTEPGAGAGVNAGDDESVTGEAPAPSAHDAFGPYERRLWAYEDYYAGWMAGDPWEQKYAEYRESGMSRIREAGFSVVCMEDCKGIKPPFNIDDAPKWIIFVNRQGRLADGYAERFGTILADHPEAVAAYADEDWEYETVAGKRRIEPWFKPDWSPDTFDSFFYFGGVALLRTDFAIRADWLGSSDPFANVYDLFLQAAEKAGKTYDDARIVHVPQVLFHNDADAKFGIFGGNASKPEDDYAAWKAACDVIRQELGTGRLTWGSDERFDEIKKRSFKRRCMRVRFLEGQDGVTRHVLRDNGGEPLVSVLVLSKDHPDVLRCLLDSFLERTDYHNLEFVVVDNGSTDANKSEYESVIEDFCGGIPHRYVYSPMEFNFSAMCNLAAANATGDLLLFMNDDVEIVQKDWLRLMAGCATMPHVGAVGAKLLYADTDLIQHVGITSMEIGPSHKLVIYPDDVQYYYGKNLFQADVLGVTAACMMIAADKFERVGGFDESFPVAYNDVEISFRIVKSGLVNVQCNGALLYHHESLSRGKDEGDRDKWDRLLKEKKRLYQIHPEFFESDPYYNPNLIGNDSRYLSNCDFGYNKHTLCAVFRQQNEGNLAESAGEGYKISVDFAGIQSKLNLEEPEIIKVRGWAFMPGRDNSLLGADVVLQNITDGIVYEVKSHVMPRKDLEKAFAIEKNVGLCGFVARVLKDDLTHGEYRVGIRPKALKHDLTEWETLGNTIFTGVQLTIA